MSDDLPIGYLRDLARLPLPCTILDGVDVQLVRALRESGHILATFFKLDRKTDYARVLALTPLGRNVLAAQALKEISAGRSAQRWLP